MQISDTQNRRRAGASMLIVLDVILLLLILAIATHTIVMSRLHGIKPAVQQQLAFWQQRSDELCVEQGQRPQAPTLTDNSDQLDEVNSLGELKNFSAKVWEKYKSCQEPISQPIPEALLHFKFNSYNEYEGNELTGFAQIHKYVDQYIRTHNQIYVIGHTDDVDSEEYNYKLSYLRALEVSTRIQDYLSSLGKKRGRDYELYAIGMGKSQLLKREPGETDEDWGTRCRRLELEFRSLSRANQKNR